MNVAIVVAGGKGTRFGGNRPKQFLELRGTPIIIHTLKQFECCREIDSIVVVLPAAETAGFESLAQKFDLKKIVRVVTGGDTRARSVQNGLASIDEATIVAVHDGVRPFVMPDEIDQTVRAARAGGAAILVTGVSDTIKEVKNDVIVNTPARKQLRRALTPQCFRLEILRDAYAQLSDLEAAGIEVTDDSFLVERLGVQVAIVEGSSRNIKITNEEDLAVAALLLD